MSAEFRVRLDLRGSGDLQPVHDQKHQAQGLEEVVPQPSKPKATISARALVPPSSSNIMLWREPKVTRLSAQARRFGSSASTYSQQIHDKRYRMTPIITHETTSTSLQSIPLKIKKLQEAIKTQKGEKLLASLTELENLEMTALLIAEVQELPLSNARQSKLQNNLITAAQSGDIKRLTEGYEQLNCWKRYTQLKTKREQVQELFDQLYPKIFRVEEIRTRKTLEKDAFYLARNQLNKEAKGHLAKVLADDDERAEPQDFTKLLQEIAELEKLYENSALKEFLQAYEKSQAQLRAENPALNWEDAMEDATVQLAQYGAELEAIEQDLEFIYALPEPETLDHETSEKLTKISTQAKSYQQYLLNRKTNWTQIENALELQLQDAEAETLQIARDSGNLPTQEEAQALEEGEIDAYDPALPTIAEDEVLAQSLEVIEARKRLVWFRQTLEDLSQIDWNDTTSLAQNLEDLVGAVDVLAEYEKAWFDEEIEKALTKLNRTTKGEDIYVSQLYERWDNLKDSIETNPKDYQILLKLIKLREELTHLDKLELNSLYIFNLYNDYGSFLKQDFPSEENMGRVVVQIQILKGFGSAQKLNPKHPKVLELKAELQEIAFFLHPDRQSLGRLLQLSQEAALATNVEAKLKVWDEKEEAALLVDAAVNYVSDTLIENTLGASVAGAFLTKSNEVPRDKNMGALEIRNIRDQYSRVEVLLSQGRFTEAQGLFSHLESNPSVRGWFQDAQNAEVFRDCMITAGVVVLSGGLAAAASAYVGAGAAAINSGARGFQAIRITLQTASNAKRLQAATEGSLLVRGIMLGAKAGTFVPVNRYLNHSLHDKAFFDPKKEAVDNWLELGKEVGISAGMFAMMGWAMRTYQVFQARRLFPIARAQFKAAVGEEVFEAMDKFAQEAGIQTELENLMRRGWSGLNYQLGSLGTELASFGAWDPVGMNLEANWQSLRAGKGFTLMDPTEILFSWEAWKERFVFVVALRASGALMHPLPKAPQDPIRQAQYTRIKQAEAKLARRQTKNPQSMDAETLHQLENILRARQDYLKESSKDHPASESMVMATAEALGAIEVLKNEFETLGEIFGKENKFGVQQIKGHTYQQYEPAEKEALLDCLTKHSPGESWSYYPENGLIEIKVKDPVTQKIKTVRLFPNQGQKSASPENTIQAPPPGQNIVSLAQEAWNAGVETFVNLELPFMGRSALNPRNVWRWLPLSLNMMAGTPEVRQEMEAQEAPLEGRAEAEPQAIPLPSTPRPDLQLDLFQEAADMPSYLQILDTGKRQIPKNVGSQQDFTTFGKNPPKADRVYDQELSFMVKTILKNNPDMSPNEAWKIFGEIITTFENNPTPTKVSLGTKMYKLVPKGVPPSQYTPFWLNSETLENLKSHPERIGNRLGLPAISFPSGEFEIYEITAQHSTTVYEGQIAPIGERGFLRFATEDQVAIVDRNNNWSQPKLIGNLYDTKYHDKGFARAMP